MTWLQDIVRALNNLNGEARWTDLVNETFRIRDEKKEYIGRFSTFTINSILNENRDGNGKDIFSRVSRGIYILKVPEGQETLDIYSIDESDDNERQSLINETQKRLQKLEQFEKIVMNKDSTELDCGNYLKDEPWILNLNYLSAISEQKIGLNGRTDFLIEKYGGEYDIIELKGPNEVIFLKKESHDYYRLSRISKDALSQMIYYLSKYDKYYLFQREETKKDVLYPEGIIVIGKQNDIEDSVFQIHNNFFNRIKFTSYDRLIKSCRTTLLYLYND